MSSLLAPVRLAARPARPLARFFITLPRCSFCLAVVALSMYVFSVRDQAQRFAAYGYPGIFLISLLANATILLPAPGVAVVFAMGSVFSPPFVALGRRSRRHVWASSRRTQPGLAGRPSSSEPRPTRASCRGCDRYGGLTTFVLAAIPNPFFDLAGMAAGALRMPLVHVPVLVPAWEDRQDAVLRLHRRLLDRVAESAGGLSRQRARRSRANWPRSGSWLRQNRFHDCWLCSLPFNRRISSALRWRHSPGFRLPGRSEPMRTRIIRTTGRPNRGRGFADLPFTALAHRHPQPRPLSRGVDSTRTSPAPIVAVLQDHAPPPRLEAVPRSGRRATRTRYSLVCP